MQCSISDKSHARSSAHQDRAGLPGTRLRRHPTPWWASRSTTLPPREPGGGPGPERFAPSGSLRQGCMRCCRSHAVSPSRRHRLAYQYTKTPVTCENCEFDGECEIVGWAARHRGPGVGSACESSRTPSAVNQGAHWQLLFLCMHVRFSTIAFACLDAQPAPPP